MTRPRGGADFTQAPGGTFELLGVRVTLVGDQRVFADPRIGLAQSDAVLLGQPIT
jgi:hypothetical protein